MLNKKEQARYRAIINQLSRMSHNGWDKYTHPDWEILEKELDTLGEKMVRKMIAFNISRECAKMLEELNNAKT